ncbi:MAG: hypothetical protein AB1896_21880, partial [Thermodesulfobacteriota bacterium]
RTIPNYSLNGQPGYKLSLPYGWNMTGNPFNFPVSVGDIYVGQGGVFKKLTDPGNTFTQQIFWVWSGGTYVAAALLGEGEGGWIKCLSSGGCEVFYPAGGGAGDAAADMIQPAADVERPPLPPGAFSDAGAGGGGGGGGGCFVDAAGENPPEE